MQRVTECKEESNPKVPDTPTALPHPRLSSPPSGFQVWKERRAFRGRVQKSHQVNPLWTGTATAGGPWCLAGAGVSSPQPKCQVWCHSGVLTLSMELSAFGTIFCSQQAVSLPGSDERHHMLFIASPGTGGPSCCAEKEAASKLGRAFSFPGVFNLKSSRRIRKIYRGHSLQRKDTRRKRCFIQRFGCHPCHCGKRWCRIDATAQCAVKLVPCHIPSL